MGGQRHDQGTLPREKARYPFYRRLAGRPVRPRRERQILPLVALVPLPVQNVASTNTEYANLVHYIEKIYIVDTVSDFWII